MIQLVMWSSSSRSNWLPSPVALALRQHQRRDDRHIPPGLDGRHCQKEHILIPPLLIDATTIREMLSPRSWHPSVQQGCSPVAEKPLPPVVVTRKATAACCDGTSQHLPVKNIQSVEVRGIATTYTWGADGHLQILPSNQLATTSSLAPPCSPITNMWSKEVRAAASCGPVDHKGFWINHLAWARHQHVHIHSEYRASSSYTYH